MSQAHFLRTLQPILRIPRRIALPICLTTRAATFRPLSLVGQLYTRICSRPSVQVRKIFLPVTVGGRIFRERLFSLKLPWLRKPQATEGETTFTDYADSSA